MPICHECQLTVKTGNYYRLRGWLCKDCLNKARDENNKTPKDDLLKTLNEYMNKTQWSIITNEKLTLDNKIKELDKLFKKYCETLKKIFK